MTPTVADRLRAAMPELPRAERAVARELLADYPAAGLLTVARLAGQAKVSGPTVLRLLERLGFEGYAEFQEALREELQQRSRSPLDQYESAGDERDVIARSRRALTQCVTSTFDLVDAGEFDHAAELLGSSRRRVYATGGRFSSLVARMLTLHLEILRPHVVFLGAEDRTSALMDIRSRDVVFAVDLRRYQANTVAFGAAAAARGAQLILLTDRWRSPLASEADVVLTAGLDAPSAFDSLVGAAAVVEALIARVMDDLGDGPRARMKAYDEAWSAFDFPADDTKGSL